MFRFTGSERAKQSEIRTLLRCISLHKILNAPLGNTYYILWSMNPDRGFSAMSEEKKIKIKFHKSDFIFLSHIFLQVLPIFWRKYYRFGKKNSTFLGMLEEKIEKMWQKFQFFFLSGTFSARRRNHGPKNIVSVALLHTVSTKCAGHVRKDFKMSGRGLQLNAIKCPAESPKCPAELRRFS